MLRTLPAAELAGIRAVVVHAKDDEARAFYERFDFSASPTDPYQSGSSVEGCARHHRIAGPRVKVRRGRKHLLGRDKVREMIDDWIVSESWALTGA
ncbi:MAG TPA: hypothetical protein VFC47_09745 [Caulobacteraceae bacterium]|nr:hypothetical protein [Caulobacteraceae bacterium]